MRQLIACITIIVSLRFSHNLRMGYCVPNDDLLDCTDY